MPSLKLRYLYLFFILASLLLVWASRTQLAEIAISKFIHDYGLQAVTTDIRQLDLGSSHISSIEFTVVTETGPLQLEAHDIKLSYKLHQLANGHIDKLTVNKILLTRKSTAKKSAVPGAASEILVPVNIIASLRQIMREYLFFNTLTIDQLSLSGESYGVFQERSFRIVGVNNAGKLRTELSLQDQHPAGQQDVSDQQVVINLTEDAILVELIQTTKADNLAARLDLAINDTEVSGNYYIAPRRLVTWLRPFVNLKSINETGVVSGKITADLESDDHIIADLSATSDRFVFNAYNANNAVLELRISIPTGSPYQNIKLLTGSHIKANRFGYGAFTIDDTQINLIGELVTAGNAWQFNGDISSSHSSPGYESQILRLDEITARISANAENLKASGNFATADAPGSFAFSLQHDLIRSSGHFSIEPLNPLNLNAENHRLSQLLTPWAYPFDLLAGKINLHARGAWSPHKDLALTTRIRLDDAGGNHGELVFSGLSLDHELELLPKIQSARSSRIDLKHLDSGVSASNISINLVLRTADSGPLPQLVIRDLQGEIFDGTFSGDDFIFDPNRDKNSFKIKATNIDLAAIIETQQLEDIKVSGRVDGTIPVVINDQGVFIEHGSFINNVSEGTIRYNPATGTEQLKQNPITGIALAALRDFRYSHLSADVNFTPEGMLSINLQLKGTSPELDTNRPVHLNINTEQNLLSLLKSLRYAEGVSANIDMKVRRQYEKTKNTNRPVN